MTKERQEIKKLVRMMREAGVRYRASKPVIELLEWGADEIERLAFLVQSNAEPVEWQARFKGKRGKLGWFTITKDSFDDADSSCEYRALYEPPKEVYDKVKGHAVTQSDACEGLPIEAGMTGKERQKLLDDLLNLLNMFREKADDCDIEFKQTYDPAAASAAYAYTEAAGELERLRTRIKK